MQLMANNGATTLANAGGITAVATSLTVANASVFPAVVFTSDYFYLTLSDAGNTISEVVMVTATSGAIFTVVRAQDNTTARSWPVGSLLQMRVTAQMLRDLSGGIVGQMANDENVLTGSGNAAAGMITRVIASAAATITLPAASTHEGETLAVVIDHGSGSYLVTIQDALGAYIDYDNVNGTQTGRTTRIMWAGEAAVLYSNGTYWHKVGGKTIPMISALGSTGSQTLTAATVTQLTTFTVSLQNSAPAAMINTGSQTLTALRLGTYLIVVGAFFAGGNFSVACSPSILAYKNGSMLFQGVTSLSATSLNCGAAINKSVILAAGDAITPWGKFSTGTNSNTFRYNDAGAGTMNWFTLTEIPTW